MKYFISFKNITDESRHIGKKARNLSVLYNNSFSVPDGYILPAYIFENIFQNDAIFQDFLLLPSSEQIKKLSEIRSLIMHYQVASDFSDELNIILSFENEKYIVRSSSSDEDQGNHSFAGIYTSIPDLTSTEEVIDGIKKVWSSLWTKKAFTYRKERNISGFGKMSVILQKQIEPLISGIIFTRNPSTGEKDFFINCSMGRCENTVSGKNIPLSIVLEVKEINDPIIWEVKNKVDISILSEELISSLISNAIKIEKLFHLPQDIEWAYDGKLQILQARPITTGDRIKWSREPVIDFIPEYLTPLSSSFYKDFLSKRFFSFFQDIGIRKQSDCKILENKGRIYVNENLLNSFFKELYGERFYSSYFPVIWEYLMNFPLAMEDYKRNADQCINEEISRVDSIEKLWEKFSKIKIFLYSNEPAFTVSCFLHILSDYYNNLLPEECKEYVDFFQTLMPLDENIDTYTFHRDLIELIKDRKMKYFITSQKNIEKPDILNRFIHCYGHLTDQPLELAGKRYRENENYIIELVTSFHNKKKMQIIEEHGAKLNCEKARIKIEDLKEKYEKSIRRPDMVDYFNRIINWLIYLTNQREENRKYNLLITEKIRNIFVLMGEKLKDKGLLKNKEDIFFLDLSEIEIIMPLDKYKNVWIEHIDLVKRNFEETKELEFPHQFSGVVPKPASKNIIKITSGAKLEGEILNSGIITGKARVIDNSMKLGEFERGEILVIPDCEPLWSIIFPLAAGLVTERGGFLSHGAILSREYNIPAVSGINSATKIIKTGDLIKVNGNEGSILIEEKL